MNSQETTAKTTLRKGLSVFGVICIVGTAVYVYAGWGWLDAIYMVTITIFGVGYGEVRPIEEPWLKLFTTGFIFAGCSSLIYVIGGIVQLLAEGEIQRIMGNRNRTKELDQLNDHTIICGYGRVGQMLAVELANENKPFVVLDRNPERFELAIADGFLAWQGDAVEDHVLTQVGLFRARTLATVLPDDATNVFITLTARDMCESIQIIARAESPSTERKLIRGGATSVVMPAAISAIRIAQLTTESEVKQMVLPEKRYRMIERNGSTTSGDQTRANSVSSCTTSTDATSAASRDGIEANIHDEVETLADLASELGRSMIDRRMDRMVDQKQ